MSQIILDLFKNWEIKKSLVSPVIVNLLTALVLFFAVVMFKEPFYRLIKPNPEVEQFPLYCIAEPYVKGDGGLMMADLFIINLRDDKSFTEKDLESILRTRKPDRNIQPYIEIVSTRRNVKILDVKADDKFNEDKGELEVIPPKKDGKPWIVMVNEISRKAILTLRVYTDLKSPPISRDAKTALPFDVNYPGK
jgi:hypothetical protein